MGFLSNIFNKILGIENDQDSQGTPTPKKFSLAGEDLTPEIEEKMINELVMKINSYELREPATILLFAFKPFATITAQTSLIFLAPIFELLGIKGYKWVSFFNKKDNVERLVRKLEERE
jgi:hypothetical protein